MTKLSSVAEIRADFTCAICRGTFECGLTDEEAEAQLAKEFPGTKPSECGLVCEDCFVKMFGGPQ